MGLLNLLDQLEAELSHASHAVDPDKKDEHLWNARSIATELRVRLDRERPGTGEWERIKRDDEN